MCPDGGAPLELLLVILQAAAQQADTVMGTELQGSEAQPGSSARAEEAPAPEPSQNAQAGAPIAPTEETPESLAAKLLEDDRKRRRERKAAPAPKPEDMSALLPE